MEGLTGAHALEGVVALLHLALGLGAQLVDTLAAVQRATDLFIGLDKAQKLNGEVSVLVDQHVAVVLQGVDFALHVTILSLEGLVGEAEIVLLSLGGVEVLLTVAALAFEFAELGSQVVVAVTLGFEALAQVALLGLLAVKRSSQLILFSLEAGSLVPSLQEVYVGGVESLSSLLEVVVSVLRNFLELLCTLLKLEEAVLSSLDALIGLAVFTLLVAVDVAKAIDLLLVAATLLLELLKLEGSCVNIFSEGEGVVALRLALTLVAEDLGLSAGDLLTESSDLHLHVVVATVLIVEVVSGVVALFLEAVQGDAV